MATSKRLIGPRLRRSIAYAAGSHVHLSVAPAKGKVPKMKGGSGRSLKGAFAVFDRDSSLLKTCEGCYLQTVEGNLVVFSEVFPSAGTMRSGVLYPRNPSVRRIDVKESSSRPTVRATDSTGPHYDRMASPGYVRKRPVPNLSAVAGSWPTPDASVSEGYNQSDSPNAAKRLALAGLAKTWPTPREFCERDANYDRGKCNLGEVAGNWATPTSRDHKDGSMTGGGRNDELPPWPPGPEERDKWASILATHPELAPALPVKSNIRRVADGIPFGLDCHRINRLKALGNAVVPRVAEIVGRRLLELIE